MLGWRSKIEIVNAVVKGRIGAQVIRLGKHRPRYIAESANEINPHNCQSRSFLNVDHVSHDWHKDQPTLTAFMQL